MNKGGAVFNLQRDFITGNIFMIILVMMNDCKLASIIRISLAHSGAG